MKSSVIVSATSSKISTNFNSMIRYILLALSLFFFLSSEAFAKKRVKTEGFQIGLDALYSKAGTRYYTDKNYVTVERFEDSGPGVGMNIKYVYNIDDILPAEPLVPFFVYTEIFGQQLNNSAQDPNQDNINLTKRYGAKIGFGADIAPNFFIFASGGLGVVGYELDWKSVDKKKSGNSTSLMYGGGFGYHFGPHFILSLEINHQKTKFKTDRVYTGVEEYGDIISARGSLNVAQLGFAVQF